MLLVTTAVLLLGLYPEIRRGIIMWIPVLVVNVFTFNCRRSVLLDG